jgi:hypothetical protein
MLMVIVTTTIMIMITSKINIIKGNTIITMNIIKSITISMIMTMIINTSTNTNMIMIMIMNSILLKLIPMTAIT